MKFFNYAINQSIKAKPKNFMKRIRMISQSKPSLMISERLKNVNVFENDPFWKKYFKSRPKWNHEYFFYSNILDQIF